MIARLTLVCIATFIAMRITVASAANDAPAPAPAAAPLVLPSFGVTVTAPPLWRPIPETNASQIARWVVDGADGKPAAVIEFSMVAAAGRGPGQIAESIAQQHGGKAAQSDLRMGDAPTMKVLHEPPAPGSDPATGQAPGNVASAIVPRSVYVAAHDGHLYMMLLLANDATRGDALDAAARSVKFDKIASPVGQSLSSQALPLFGAEGLTIRLPASMRPAKSPDPAKQLAYTLNDNRTGQAQMTLLIQGMAKPADLPVQAVADSLAARLTKQFGLDGPIQIAPPHAASPAARVWRTAPFPEPTNANNRHVIFLVEHGDTQLFLLMFRASPTDPADVDAYAKLANEAADSITAVKVPVK